MIKSRQVFGWFFWFSVFSVNPLSLCFAQSPSNAYSVGRSEIEFTGRSVSSEVKERAIASAKENAIRAYFADRSDTDARRFAAIEAEIFGNIENFLISSSILGDAVNSDRKRYSVTVQVHLNINRLNQKLVPDLKPGTKDKPELAFLFITRQLVEQQRFDEKIIRRADYSQRASGGTNFRESLTEKEIVANENISGTTGFQSGGNNSDTSSMVSIGGNLRKDSTSASSNLQRDLSSSVSVTKISETEGSVTSRATQRIYKLSSSGTFNAAFLERLTAQAWNYDPIELETEPNINLNAAKNDYATEEEIKPENLQKLFSEARSSGFKYIALGTLNVSLPTIDREINLKRVSVEINAKVYEISGRRARTILTVQPTLVSGFDIDEGKAQSKAIREAALRSAREFLSQLSNRSISD